MRLGLSQHLRTEQRMIQSPQMIQAMKILQCPAIELQDQIEQELQDNVFLELKETGDEEQDGEHRHDQREETTGEEKSLGEKLESEFNLEIDQLEQRIDRNSKVRGSAEEADRRLEALYNTPDSGISLADYLLEQVRMLAVSNELYRVVEHLVFSFDTDGRLTEQAEAISTDLLVPIPLAQEAIDLIRSLDPSGVGAQNLRDCLLMQIDRLTYVRPLTRILVEKHLDALAMNKLPKIAKETGESIEEIKESWEYLRMHLNPHPGSEFSTSMNSTVIPDVVVDEIDGRFEVRAERGSVPELAISSSYRNLLKEARNDPKVYEYLRRKIDAAKWFIEAVHQRQTTIQRIASTIVERQTEFLRRGIQHLKPMKMQDVADEVGVHISTVSRAISGKFIQTPQGIFDIKRFFSGGTVTDSGKVLSQQAVKEKLRQIIAAEDKSAPLSDDQLVESLRSQGVQIARRTVTKYRKALGLESSSRRREY